MGLHEVLPFGLGTDCTITVYDKILIRPAAQTGPVQLDNLLFSSVRIRTSMGRRPRSNRWHSWFLRSISRNTRLCPQRWCRSLASVAVSGVLGRDAKAAAGYKPEHETLLPCPRLQPSLPKPVPTRPSETDPRVRRFAVHRDFDNVRRYIIAPRRIERDAGQYPTMRIVFIGKTILPLTKTVSKKLVIVLKSSRHLYLFLHMTAR